MMSVRHIGENEEEDSVRGKWEMGMIEEIN
jgi:hypothetical protein